MLPVGWGSDDKPSNAQAVFLNRASLGAAPPTSPHPHQETGKSENVCHRHSLEGWGGGVLGHPAE